MWVPAELKDPILLHAPTRKSGGYFGAVRLRDGKLLTRQEGKVFDAQTFWQFLKQLRQVSARYVKFDGYQCGYCTSGQIMSAVALLKEPEFFLHPGNTPHPRAGAPEARFVTPAPR